MAIPVNAGVKMSKLKSRILNPSLTSVYTVYMPKPKDELLNFMSADLGISFDSEIFELTCVDASLPGSSVATLENSGDYMGITQKMAYRRMYDDTIDFTFLVTQDSRYLQIRFFESWIRYIVGESEATGNGIRNDGFYSRVRYPSQYQSSEIQIAKYEKSLGSGNDSISPAIIYKFVNAFPKSISSIPVSYEASDLLKVTVSLSYDRYYVTQESFLQDLQFTNILRQRQTEFERFLSRQTTSILDGVRQPIDFGLVGAGTEAEASRNRS
jgi:hypothetical protein